MCKKKQFKYCPSEIDFCMRNLIKLLNDMGFKTFACCCGHGKYNMTIVGASEVYVGKGKDELEYYDLVSMKVIPRKRNFYKKDKSGYYFIPETLVGTKTKVN